MPLLGVTLFEFCWDLCPLTTRVSGLSCWPCCVILEPFWYNTGVWQTDRQTTRQVTISHLAFLSRLKSRRHSYFWPVSHLCLCDWLWGLALLKVVFKKYSLFQNDMLHISAIIGAYISNSQCMHRYNNNNTCLVALCPDYLGEPVPER